MSMMKTALTIAGSDSCGGAGIQADIKTMTMNGVYAMSAITALTAQNTTGVFGIQEVSPEFLEQQIEAIVTDIFPDAVKTGMVSSAALIKTIAQCIKKFSLKNVIVDPVMVATSGAKLISDEAIETLKTELLPLAALITPNIPEAEALCGRAADPRDLAKRLYGDYGCAVLVKGGHGSGTEAVDVLFDGGNLFEFALPRVANPVSTHGTGCSLAAALAAEFALERDAASAVKGAKAYVHDAIARSYWVGDGCGVLGFAPRAAD